MNQTNAPALAVIITPDGVAHLEATIGGPTACGLIVDPSAEVVTVGSFDCPACRDALALADELHGAAHALRALAGAALVAADRLDPTGGYLTDDTEDSYA